MTSKKKNSAGLSATVEPKQLAAALSGAAAIVDSRAALPILAMVRLVSSGGQLQITTSDLNIQYQQSIKSDGDDFSCAVDAKRLLQMAGAADQGKPFTMSVDGDRMTIKAGKSRWTLPVLPSEDFPTMSADGLSTAMPVNQLAFAGIAKATLWAGSDEMSRPYLNGVYINHHDGKSCFSATNGQVLATADTAYKWPKGAPNVIVSKATIKAIASACGDNGNVNLKWNDSRIVADFGDGGPVITSALIEGNYPDYRRIMPEPCDPIAIDTDVMVSAVRRVKIASDAKDKKLRITRLDGALSISIEGTAGMEGVEDIAADCQAGFTSGANADYITNMLAAISAESVTIEQKDENSVMQFRPVSQDVDIDFTGLVMPMAL